MKQNKELQATLNEVSKNTNVSIEDILSKKRHAPICAARADCYIILRERYGFSFEEIGAFFNRNYSNIVILYNKATNGKNKLTPTPDSGLKLNGMVVLKILRFFLPPFHPWKYKGIF